MGAPLVQSLETLGVHDHAALFYRTAREMVAAAAPFLRIGLSRGEKCLLYAPPATAEAILAGMRGEGTDIGGALARGSLLVSRKGSPGGAGGPARSGDVIAYLRAAVRQARSEKYSALRLCMDIRFALDKDPRGERMFEFQGKMVEFLGEHDALSMCLHGIGEMSTESLLDALRAHPTVIYKGKVLDNFYFAPPSDETGTWTTGENLARRLSHLVLRQEQVSSTRRHAIRLKRFRDVTASLLAQAAVPDILNGIAEGVISLGYRMCWIGMAKADGSVELVAGWGDRKGSLKGIGTRWDRTPLGSGPVGVAIRSGKPDVVRDIARSRRFAPWRDATSALGLRSVAAVPLGEEGKPIGALVVCAKDADAFDKEALEELSAFAQQASLVLIRARENQRLRESEEMSRTMAEEKVRLHRGLAQAQKMEAVGVLAGGIAHDFNNILGSIIGYASLMEARMDPADPFLGTATKIRLSAERAAELTAKLLGFARKGKNRVRTLSLNDVVSNVAAIVSRSFDKSIEIRTALEPSLAPVEGDAGQLEHSLLNLCLNAADAMPAGGVLAIETGNARLSDEEARRYHVGGAGDYAFLAVRDTGEGMTEEVRGHIFQPFYTTRKDKGRSGMGLPMVYGIVKNHGGGIQVESEPGKGASVRIHLPATSRAEIRGPDAETIPPPAGRATVLLVDDEPAIRDMGKELLSALGYEALQAEGGEAACALFRERGKEIGLVILDLVMPRMGGKETFESLRRMDPGVPVLLSSGYTVNGMAQEILDAGANGFIQKPYRIAELARAVRAILDSAGDR